MKTSLRFSVLNLSAVAVATLIAAIATHAAPPDAANNAARSAETNTVPKSVYLVPRTFAEGRDPFFPNRTMGTPLPVINTNPAVTAVVPLTLNGISDGFVMINGKTIGLGETADVNTASGRVQVRCIEIKLKDNAAVVEVDGERRELTRRDR